MTGLEFEPSDIVGAVLMFAIGITTAATAIAFAKPFCKSWLRCSVVSFAALLLPASVLDLIIGIGGPPVQTRQAVFDGIKLAILVAPFAGLALWQWAKQGSKWYWPYRGPLS